MTKFWKVEEWPTRQHSSSEEQIYEDCFARHDQRDNSGRYIVASLSNEKKTRIRESHCIGFFRSNENSNTNLDYGTVRRDYKQISHTRAYGARKSDERARFLPVAWRGLQTLEFQQKGSNGFP